MSDIGSRCRKTRLCPSPFLAKLNGWVAPLRGLFLPPFLMFNQILIYTLGYPTMVLAGRGECPVAAALQWILIEDGVTISYNIYVAKL